MASSMIERPGQRSESHQRDHLKSFIASKQAYLDAKAAQQRAEHAAQICKSAPSPKLTPIKEVFAFARVVTVMSIALILKVLVSVAFISKMKLYNNHVCVIGGATGHATSGEDSEQRRRCNPCCAFEGEFGEEACPSFQ